MERLDRYGQVVTIIISPLAFSAGRWLYLKLFMHPASLTGLWLCLSLYYVSHFSWLKIQLLREFILVAEFFSHFICAHALYKMSSMVQHWYLISSLYKSPSSIMLILKTEMIVEVLHPAGIDIFCLLRCAM